MILRGEQFALHRRNLAECGAEPLLRGDGLVGAQITFGRNGVQPLFIDHLVALRLRAEITGADAVHQQDGGCDDRPADQQTAACPGEKLGFGLEADKPGFAVRAQKKAFFGKAAFKSLMNGKGYPVSQTSGPLFFLRSRAKPGEQRAVPGAASSRPAFVIVLLIAGQNRNVYERLSTSRPDKSAKLARNCRKAGSPPTSARRDRTNRAGSRRGASRNQVAARLRRAFPR